MRSLELRLLARPRRAAQLEQLAVRRHDRAATSGSLAARQQVVGKADRRPRRRARPRARAWRAVSSSRLLVTIARLARVMVSSSRTTTSPAFTWSPSRTRISPTTPPVGCWTFLTLVSTTSVPGAITAPANSVVAAQPPMPPTSRTTAATPSSEMAADGRWRVWQSLPASIMTLSLRDSATTLQRRGREPALLRPLPDANAWRSTSSLRARRPATRPSAITSTRSTPASALGRCATTTTMPPRARTPMIACGRAPPRPRRRGWSSARRAPPGTDRRRARGPARCAGAGRPKAPRRPRRSGSRSRPAAAGSVVHAGRLAAAMTARPGRRRHRSGRCSAPPCRRTARRPAAGSRRAGPSCSGDHWSSAAPSSRTLPRAGGQTPTSTRASDDLPEALGPMMPRAWPAFSVEARHPGRRTAARRAGRR